MGRRVVGITVAVTLFVALGGAAVMAGRSVESHGSVAAAPVDTIPFAVHVDEYGVLMSIRPSFSENRLFTGGELVVNGVPDPGVVFWTERFDDQFPPPDPFPVTSDEHVVIEGRTDPDCDDAADVPVITVRSRTTLGVPRVDAYTPASLESYRAALATWCAMGPKVVVAGSTQSPDGEFTVTLNLFNPTSEPVRVESAAMTEGDTSWQPASMVVAPDSRAQLVLHGHGEGCAARNPWTTGRVTINGVPAELDEWESEQC